MHTFYIKKMCLVNYPNQISECGSFGKFNLQNSSGIM